MTPWAHTTLPPNGILMHLDQLRHFCSGHPFPLSTDHSVARWRQCASPTTTNWYVVSLTHMSVLHVHRCNHLCMAHLFTKPLKSFALQCFSMGQTPLQKCPFTRATNPNGTSVDTPIFAVLILLFNCQNPLLYNACQGLDSGHPSSVPSYGVSWPHLIQSSMGHPSLHTNQQFDRFFHFRKPCYSLCSNRPHLCTQCMRCGLKTVHNNKRLHSI